MADIYSRAKRSWLMSRVRGKDTHPERQVRSFLHRAGFRFRLYQQDLPGKPDIVLPKHHTAVFIHGCFWHGHPGCRRAVTPKTNRAFWTEKIKGNQQRDREVRLALRRLGWQVLTVWECQVGRPVQLAAGLKRLFNNGRGKTRNADRGPDR